MATPADELSLQDQALLTAGGSMWETASPPASGLDVVRMADGPMGIASGRVDERDVSVLTPCGVALAASWDPDVVRRVGALVGEEARRKGVQVVLAPNLNMPRSPLAGRAFETFSEDPLLTGVLGCAWIEGLQSRGVGACAKHIAGNDSETQRNTMNAVIDPRALHEVYLLPFEMAVRCGVWGVMAAYNRLNGVHCAQSGELLQDIVKAQWGFDGPIMSDWFGALDGVASAKAGLDLEMPGPGRQMGAKLEQAVRAGELDPARVEDAARRVLTGVERLRTAAAPPPLIQDDGAVLLEAAAAGFTLLKNNGALLPLDPRAGGRIAVIGPNAFAPCYQGGTFAKIALRPDAETPVGSIRKRFAARVIAFEPGLDPQPRLPSMPVTPARDLGDGRHGMTVDYFVDHDLSKPPLFSETRDTNSLTWFAMPGDASPDSHGAIRAAGVFTPEIDGEHTFYAGATGPVRLLLDGREVYRRDVQPAPSDLMGVLKAGEAEGVAIHLQAHAPVRVEVELRYAPFRAQGVWYGVRAPDNASAMLARAEALARDCEAVILVVGESSDSGVESKDRTTTSLDAAQLDLIRRISAVNSNTTVIVNVAHALDLSWADQAAAIMVTWFPGEMFGPALAAVLSGDLEPGGRLPVSFAFEDDNYPALDLTPDAAGDLVYAEGRNIGYRGFRAKGVAPRYGFGDGFGYTRFTIEATGVKTRPDGGATVLVSLSNTAGRDGKAVVQAYIDGVREDEGVQTLAGWSAVWLKAGDSVATQLDIPPRAFQQWDPARREWTRPAIQRRLRIGLSSLNLAQQLTIDP